MSALVQQATAEQVSGTTLVFSLTGVAAGSLVVVRWRERDGGGAPVSVSGSLNGAYTLGGTDTFGMHGYYFPNSAAGNETVTITYGASVTAQGNISEFSGIAASPPVLTNGVINAAGTSHPHGSISPTASLVLTLMGFFPSDSGAVTQHTGFTVQDKTATAAERQNYSYKTGHSGAIDPTVTSTNSVESSGVVISFSESADAVVARPRYIGI